ncbi:MAG: MarR family transcriptional regulator [Cellulomonas sp.]
MSHQHLDTDTGEIRAIAIIVKPRHKTRFTIVFQHELLVLLTGAGADLTALEWKILLHQIATTGYSNTSETYVKEIADALHHDRSAVSKALHTLEERKLIRRSPNHGNRPSTITLNPHVVFRGNIKERIALMKTGWFRPTLPTPDIEQTEELAS